MRIRLDCGLRLAKNARRISTASLPLCSPGHVVFKHSFGEGCSGRIHKRSRTIYWIIMGFAWRLPVQEVYNLDSLPVCLTPNFEVEFRVS